MHTCFQAFVAIGSNQGCREKTIQSAINMTVSGRIPSTQFVRGSSLYESLPVGPAKASFLNGVFELTTELNGVQLLDHLLEIEVLHGRIRREHWGDRSLDLDLLFMQKNGEALHLQENGLVLPHPRIRERDFVLRPWSEIAGELNLEGETVAQHLQRLNARSRTILRVLPIKLRPESIVC